MIRLIVVLTVAASLLIGGAATAPSATKPASTHFDIAGILHGTGAVDAACNGFGYATEGGVEGTPIGSAHWTGSECVDVVTDPGGFLISGTFSLDDGLLVGTYEGHAGMPDAAGYVYGSGTFSVTGGTRRYTNVAGSGIFTVVAQPALSRAQMRLVGALQRVPASKEGRVDADR